MLFSQSQCQVAEPLHLSQDGSSPPQRTTPNLPTGSFLAHLSSKIQPHSRFFLLVPARTNGDRRPTSNSRRSVGVKQSCVSLGSQLPVGFWCTPWPLHSSPHSLSLLAQKAHQLAISHLFFSKHEPIYTQRPSYPARFDPEDGGNVYIRNLGNI